jgi:hypothetical protein
VRGAGCGYLSSAVRLSSAFLFRGERASARALSDAGGWSIDDFPDSAAASADWTRRAVWWWWWWWLQSERQTRCGGTGRIDRRRARARPVGEQEVPVGGAGADNRASVWKSECLDDDDDDGDDVAGRHKRWCRVSVALRMGSKQPVVCVCVRVCACCGWACCFLSCLLYNVGGACVRMCVVRAHYLRVVPFWRSSKPAGSARRLS